MFSSNAPKIALVIIDLQGDFLGGTSSDVGSSLKAACLPHVQALLECARAKRWKVVHVGTKHIDKSTMPPHLQRRGASPYCVDCAGREFALTPKDGDEIVYKTSYSAFWKTDLKVKLMGVDTVVFAGVATDCCIQQSVFDADRLGLRSIIPYQAVSASSCESFVCGLVSMAKSAGDVFDLAKVLSGDINVPLSVDEIKVLAMSWFDGVVSIKATI